MTWIRSVFFDPTTRIEWGRKAMGFGFIALATWLLKDGTLTAVDWVDVMKWIVPAFFLGEAAPRALKAIGEAAAASTTKRVDGSEGH